MLESQSHMAGNQVISGRYEVQEPPIGRGGMGVVYKAYDSVTKRFVALKTMSGLVEPGAIELFEREWTVLARLSHPNIVDILDTGEFRDATHVRPYFVMPLLPGVTLDHLIKSSSQRLTVERTVEIMTQACRGLQAAHDQGLVHRDLKPSNIFVMDDDTVKIIDFGVVHLVDTRSMTGIKGTLQYMAPEQLEMKPSTPLSDIFSLGVVCYEALTGRKPFERKTETEVAEAIRSYIPPPASEINASVNQLLSRTLHKAMAKQPWHRFSNAREFAETMIRAMRNEPIERFDRTKIQPRIERIKKAFGEGDYQFAFEILTELESEGHIDPDMSVLRIQIEQAVRQKTIRQLIESARTRMEEEEFPLALQKVQDVLNIDPTNVDALSIKGHIERQRSEKQIDNWFRLVRSHLDNQLFSQARQGIQEILKINASETRARQLLSEIDRTEQEFKKVREQKQSLYEAALSSYQTGEISSALNKLEQVLDLTRRMPSTITPDRDAQYQSLYNQIRSERDAARNAYAEGRKNLEDRNFLRAIEICNDFLNRQPGDPMFQALKLEAEEMERQEQSAAIAEFNRRVEQEADLDKKLNIAREAAEKYPHEPHFKQSLKLVKDRRDLVNTIVSRAKQYEERGQFNDASGQWDILRNIYSQYPGLDYELQRLARRREEQAREETKGRWVEKIDRFLGSGDYSKAQEIAKEALVDFPRDPELLGLEKLSEQSIKRSAEAAVLLKAGQASAAERRFPEAIEDLRKAQLLDEKNSVIRSALLGALLDQARALVAQDWHSAQPLVEQALELDSGDPVARSLLSLLEDYKRQEAVGKYVLEARDLQAAGDLEGALKKVEQGLGSYPNELRLSQLHATLRNALNEARKNEVRPKRPAEQVPVPSGPAAASPPEKVAPPPPKPAPIDDLPAAIETIIQPSNGSPKLKNMPVAAPAAFDNSPKGVEKAAPAEKFSAVPVKPKAPPAPGPPPVYPAPVYPAPAYPTKDESRPPRKFPVLWVVAAAALILIAAFLFRPKNNTKTVPPPAPGKVALEVSLSPANAALLVDDKPYSADMSFSPGSHTAEASLDGYKAVTKGFTIPNGASGSYKLALALEPQLPELRIGSDLKNGKYILDGNPPADMQDGSAIREDIPTGDHTVKILDGAREVFSFGFHSAPQQIPTLSAPLGSKPVGGAVIGSFGKSAKVYATAGSKGGLPNAALQPIAPNGVDVADIGSGNNQYVIDDGQKRTVNLDASGTPIVTVSLSGAAESVRVLLTSNVPDATVVVNGQPLKRGFADGKRYLSLQAGNRYKIKVTHADYVDSGEQTLEVKPGESNLQPMNFNLVAIPHQPTLLIEGAPAGAEILIDEKRVATVPASGTYSSEMEPGRHTIALRKHNFEEGTVSREFRPGEQVRVNGDILKPFGTLAFKILPSNARVMCRREGEAEPVVYPNGAEVQLRSGTYEVTAQADRYTEKTEMAQVIAGKSAAVIMELTPVVAKPVATILNPGSVFENGGSWTLGSDGWWVHSGQDYSWFRKPEGTFSVSILKMKGSFGKKKKVQFDADFVSRTNRIAYTIDDHMLRRKVISDSGDTEEKDVQHGMENGPRYDLKIEITPDRVIVRNGSGSVLDSVKRTNPNGKAGFEGDVTLNVGAIR